MTDDKRKKFNIFDLALVLVIVAGVAGFFYRMYISDPAFKEKDGVRTEFFVESVQDSIAYSIQPGDEVKDPVSNSLFGNVVDVIVDKSINYGVNKDGEYVKTSIPDYKSVRFVVEGEAVFTDNGITFNNNNFFINRGLEVRVGRVRVYTKISGLEKIEEN